MGIFGKKTKAPSAKAKEGKPEAKAKPAPSMKELYGGAEAAKATDKGARSERRYGNAYCRIIKPLITEKAASSASEGKYAFAVAVDANKIEVAKAVAEVYGIMPVKVNIVRLQGKAVRHGRTMGKRKDWKKAVVTLPKGKAINIYEGV